jgi:hypothetical protein
MSAPQHLLFLGAGASFGSETNKAIVPPLAADLFDALLKSNPNVWQQVPQNIANTFRSDFEAGILMLAEKMPRALPVIQRSMAGFFYGFSPTTSSLYVRLAERLSKRSWNGAIATLNYERMLFLALNSKGISSVCNQANVQPQQVEICLPHGCCNLFCEGVRASAVGVTFSGMGVTTSGQVICVDHPDAFWNRIRNDAMPPVMSYFEPTKFTTSCAHFIEQQRQRLTALIASAQSIAIVGVQVREQDKHIWDAIGSTTAKIYYCSGNPGAAGYTEWKKRVRISSGEKDIVSTGYWDNDFDAISAFIGMT